MKGTENMKLLGSIDDNATLIGDFFPPHLLQQIHDYDFPHMSKKIQKKRMSSILWDKGLYLDKEGTKTVKDVKILDLYQYAKHNNKITEDIRDNFFKRIGEYILTCPHLPIQQNNILFMMSFYEYKKWSGINWHYDGDWTLNLSVYIHKEWDANGGGETLIETKGGYPLAVSPQPNLLLGIKNGVLHKVSAVLGNNSRQVLQARIRFLNP